MFDAEGAQNVQPTPRQTRHGWPAPSKAQDIIDTKRKEKELATAS
jgi:hypothetical protein